MGEERDNLIRRHGEKPLSDHENLSDDALMKERMAQYARKGRLPPEIEALRRKEAEEKAAQEKSGQEDSGKKDD